MFPLIILTVIFWVALVGTIFWVDPEILKGGFLFIFFGAWFFLLTLLLNNTRRGLLYGLGLTIMLGLRMMRLGNIINLILLLSVVVVVDFYFLNR